MGLANSLCDKADVEVVHPKRIESVCNTLADPRVRVRSFEKPKVRRDPRNLPAIWEAFRLIRESKPDVLHVQETFDYAYDIYSTIARFPPLVTTIHDVVPHPGDGHAAPGLQYTKAVGCWRSSRVIVHTDVMRKQLSSRFYIGEKKSTSFRTVNSDRFINFWPVEAASRKNREIHLPSSLGGYGPIRGFGTYLRRIQL